MKLAELMRVAFNAGLERGIDWHQWWDEDGKERHDDFVEEHDIDITVEDPDEES